MGSTQGKDIRGTAAPPFRNAAVSNVSCSLYPRRDEDSQRASVIGYASVTGENVNQNAVLPGVLGWLGVKSAVNPKVEVAEGES